VTAVALAADNSMVFSGGIDEVIKAWDVRTGTVQYTLTGHTDTISGLKLSPDGTKLLSNAMDNTLRIWDVRPYVSAQQKSRLVGTLSGAQHDFQKNLLKCAWSPDGSRVSAGSSDHFVNVWNVQTQQMLYKLPGHTGSVSEVDFHPTEPIILSCSSDKTLFLGEISHA
jgi:Prp8 binding protein